MSQIIGEDDLLVTMRSMSNIDGALEKTIRKWTEYVRGEAVDLCPVDTGELQQSIRATVDHLPDITGIVYTNKSYAPYVEFGTGQRGAASGKDVAPGISISYSKSIKGQAAQPYMYPALNNNRERILKGIADDLRKAMK